MSALVLASGGFVSEYLKGDAAKINVVRADLKKTEGQLKDLQARYDKMQEDLRVSKEVMGEMIDLKVGKVARLKQIDPQSPAYVSMVNEIQKDPEEMDKKLGEALKR